jgi:hypothetical protein
MKFKKTGNENINENVWCWFDCTSARKKRLSEPELNGDLPITETNYAPVGFR